MVDKPIKFVGDEHEPAHVIIELSGEIILKSSGGWMEGITIRRPRIATHTPRSEILRIESGGRLDMFHCVFDNRGSIANCVSVGSNAGGRWENTSIHADLNGKHGLFIDKNAKVELLDVSSKLINLYFLHEKMIALHLSIVSAPFQGFSARNRPI